MLRGETAMSTHVLSSPGIARAREAHPDTETSRPFLADPRMQLAVVHALTDELERCVAFGEAAHAIREQLIHEVTRLGGRARPAR
jgi:hypothetical protein